MLLFVLGIMITWAITHIYYKRAGRDQNLLYEKLNDNPRRWILEDPRKHLSVADLNELLRERTVDPDSDSPLPYKVCLKCGSANIRRDTDVDVYGDVDDEGGPTFAPAYSEALQCDECGWRISEKDHI